MINLNLTIKTPFNSKSYYNILLKTGEITKHKSWEFQIDRHSEILFSVGVDLSFNQSHSGVSFSVGLFGYDIRFEIYDNRHWNYEGGCWVNDDS